jgi:hypothetical protein
VPGKFLPTIDRAAYQKKVQYELLDKINPGFAVDLNNYAARNLPRLLEQRLAAIPCVKDVWACPDLRSGRAVITRPKAAA